jgi:hypothetical protein
MYELFLVACVGVKLCHYLMAPYRYPTESRRHIAAAVLAGQLRGARDPGLDLSYRHDCQRRVPVAGLGRDPDAAETGLR